jgi:DNA-directed RNA polymerase subunit omega
MLHPSIDKLLEQVDSKYSMVILSSKRAHSIQGVQLLETVTNKMLAEDSGKGFNLDEIVLNYEIINRTPH